MRTKSLILALRSGIVILATILPLILGCSQSKPPSEPIPANPFTTKYKVDEKNVKFFTDSDSVALLTAASPFYMSEQPLPSQNTGVYERARTRKIEEIKKEAQTLVQAVAKIKPKLDDLKGAYASYLQTSLDVEPNLSAFVSAVVVEMQKVDNGEAIVKAEYGSIDTSNVDNAYAKSFMDYMKVVKAVELASLSLQDVDQLAEYASLTLTGMSTHSSAIIQKAGQKLDSDMKALDALKPDALAIVNSRQKINYGLRQLSTGSYYFALAANDFVDANLRDLEAWADKLKPREGLTKEDINAIQQYLAVFETRLNQVKQKADALDKSRLITVSLYEDRPGVAYAAEPPSPFVKATNAVQLPLKAETDGKSTYFGKDWAAIRKDAVETAGNAALLAKEMLRPIQQGYGQAIDLAKIGVDYGVTLAVRKAYGLSTDVIDENVEMSRAWVNYQKNLDNNLSGVEVLKKASEGVKGTENAAGQVGHDIARGIGADEWMANGVGEVSKLTVGLFTGMVGSVYTLANQESTPTELGEASVSLAFSMLGGSKTLMTAPMLKSTEEKLAENAAMAFVNKVMTRQDIDAAVLKAYLQEGKAAAETMAREMAGKEALAKALQEANEKILAQIDNLPKGKLAVLGSKVLDAANQSLLDLTRKGGFRETIQAAVGKNGFEYAVNILSSYADDKLKEQIGMDGKPEKKAPTQAAATPKPSTSAPAANVPSPKPSTVQNSSGKADLTVTSVTFSPYSPKAGATLAMTFIVKNQGRSDSGPFNNRVSLATTKYGTDVSLGNFDVTNLKAGEQTTVKVTTQPLPKDAKGSYWVTVFADTFKKVNESDVNNNIGSAGPLQISTPMYAYYKVTLQLTINDKFALSQPFTRADASSTTVVTMPDDMMVTPDKAGSSSVEFSGDYSFSGSVNYYTKSYGAGATFVKDGSQSGQVTKNGKFTGYARVGFKYDAGPTLFTFHNASYYDLGDWYSTKNYLSGPGGAPTVEALKDAFKTARVVHPEETIKISGRNTYDLGSSNGVHTYDYNGTLSVKFVKAE